MRPPDMERLSSAMPLDPLRVEESIGVVELGDFVPDLFDIVESIGVVVLGDCVPALLDVVESFDTGFSAAGVV